MVKSCSVTQPGPIHEMESGRNLQTTLHSSTQVSPQNNEKCVHEYR